MKKNQKYSMYLSSVGNRGGGGHKGYLFWRTGLKFDNYWSIEYIGHRSHCAAYPVLVPVLAHPDADCDHDQGFRPSGSVSTSTLKRCFSLFLICGQRQFVFDAKFGMFEPILHSAFAMDRSELFSPALIIQLGLKKREISRFIISQWFGWNCFHSLLDQF